MVSVCCMDEREEKLTATHNESCTEKEAVVAAIEAATAQYRNVSDAVETTLSSCQLPSRKRGSKVKKTASSVQQMTSASTGTYPAVSRG
jgi:hypothetical protein